MSWRNDYRQRLYYFSLFQVSLSLSLSLSVCVCVCVCVGGYDSDRLDTGSTLFHVKINRNK